MLRQVVGKTSKAISKVHMPYTHKKVSWERISECLKVIQPGDCILTHIDGELTNIFLDYWSHIGIYPGDTLIHESVTKGKLESNLIYFLAHKDDFLILRPKFKIDYRELLDWLKKQKNLKYDFEFEMNDEQWYCFELVAVAYMMASNEVINPVKILGREQYLAKSFLNDLFEVVPC